MVSAPVYGDIKPQDDYTHPLGPEQNFNESMYFNFFDNAKGFGGFLRIGNRANEKYAEVTLTLYQPDGTVLFNWKRPEIDIERRLRRRRHEVRGHRAARASCARPTRATPSR